MIVICLISALALTQAATVVPVQSSNVDVRQSGSEFSYNIQESRGVAAISDGVPVIQPLLKTVALDEKRLGFEPHVKIDAAHQQVHTVAKAEARATLGLNEHPKDMDAKPKPITASENIYYNPFNPVPFNIFPNGPVTVPGGFPVLPPIYTYPVIRTV